jgi:hypothetical protein
MATNVVHTTALAWGAFSAEFSQDGATDNDGASSDMNVPAHGSTGWRAQKPAGNTTAGLLSSAESAIIGHDSV